MNTKTTLNTLSGIIGFLIPALFALDIYVHHLSLNFATWLMVLILDVLGVVLAYKAGNKRPYLQIGWLVAAICIVIAIFTNGSVWNWGWIETACFALSLISVVLWLTKSAEVGTWFYLAAMYISFAPQAVNYWHEPQLSTWYVWGGSALACVLAIIAAEKRDVGHILTPAAAALMNLSILVLLFR